MTAIPARLAARVLGAALTAGAEFVSAGEFAERVAGAQQPAGREAGHAPAHLAIHRLGGDLASCLSLAGAERDEGVRGTYLVRLEGRDYPETAVGVAALQRMGHRIGVWLSPDQLTSTNGSALAVEAMVDWLRSRGVRHCDALASTGAPECADALRSLASGVGVGGWVLDGRCGGEVPRRPLFHLHDSSRGWTLDCTKPEYTVAAAAPDRLTAELLSAVCDLAARGSCMYTISTELYR